MRTWARRSLFLWDRTDAGVMLLLLALDRDAAAHEWPPWKTRVKF